MEKTRGHLLWEAGVRAADPRVAIEGILRLPEEYQDMAAVADTAGEAEICDIRLEDGRAVINGRVRFCVLYANVLGGLESFKSESSFTHTIENPLIKAGMEAAVRAEIRRISVRVQDGRRAALNAELRMECLAAENRETAVLEKAEGELLRERVKVPVCAGIAVSHMAMERSVGISGTRPAAERIMMTRGRAAIRRTARDGDDLAVEGDVYAEVVYMSRDKQPALVHAAFTLPFGDVIRGAGADSVNAYVQTEKINAYIDPDDEGALLLRASLSVITAGQNISERDILRDMYLARCMPKLEKEEICVSLCEPAERDRRLVRLDIKMEGDRPEIAKVLYASATVTRTERMIKEERSVVRCEASVHIVAATEAGTRGMSLPAEFELPCTDGEAEVSVLITEASVEGTGRSLEATLAAEIMTERRQCRSFTVVTDAEETEAERRENGVIVYYADGEETLWEIAKKFRVRRDVLGENMAADDIVPGGTRLIMLK